MRRLPKLIVEPPQGPDTRSHVASWYTPGLSDGLGDRLLMFDNTGAPSLELLRFRREFVAAPGFEAALRERVEELAHLDHPNIAKVRAVEWLDANQNLALVSNHTVGRRLSELLREARGPEFAAELIRQVTPALAALHRQGPGVAHGALSLDRIIVTPEGRLVVVEHVIGAALEALRLPAWRLRAELGIAVPFESSTSPLDGRQDVVQLGYIALSLLVGRRVDPADERRQVERLLNDAARPGPERVESPGYLREWLERALQVGESGFASAREATAALEEWPEGPAPGSEGHRDDSPLLLDVRAPAERRDSESSDHPSESSGLLDEPDEILARELDLAFEEAERPIEVEDANRFREDAERPSEVAESLAEAEGQDGASSEDEAHLSGKVEPFIRRPLTFQLLAARTSPTPMIDVETLRTLDQMVVAREEPEPSSDAEIAEPVVDADEPRRGLPQVARWALAGLAVLAVAEAFVIAGLFFTGPGSDAAPLASGVALATDAETPAAGASQDNAPVPATQGTLEISSDPPGARVVVNGTERGTTPLSILVPAGEHAVVIAGRESSSRRVMNVAAGGTAVWLARLAPAASTGGWVSFDAPLQLQVMEGDRLLGSTSAPRIILPPGRHNLRLSNSTVGFQEDWVVDIQAGRTVTAKVAIPDGVLSLNALPWANVWLDGRALGTTPIADVTVPLGTHEVVWRHPQLGERRQSVVVTAGDPVRVVMDLTK